MFDGNVNNTFCISSDHCAEGRDGCAVTRFPAEHLSRIFTDGIQGWAVLHSASGPVDSGSDVEGDSLADCQGERGGRGSAVFLALPADVHGLVDASQARPSSVPYGSFHGASCWPLLEVVPVIHRRRSPHPTLSRLARLEPLLVARVSDGRMPADVHGLANVSRARPLSVRRYFCRRR